MRRLQKFLLSLALLFAIYWVLQKMNVLPSLKNIFKAQPVVIDETPILIKEIRSIGQLITYTSLDEVVENSVIKTKGSRFVDAINKLSPIPLLPSADKRLVIIGRGKVLAGIDLMEMNDNSITIVNDTVTINLPKPRIIDAILNPSDFETFEEKGEWSQQEITSVKLQARQKMIDRALNRNILQKAGNKAKVIMQKFVGNLGYKQVIVL